MVVDGSNWARDLWYSLYASSPARPQAAPPAHPPRPCHSDSHTLHFIICRSNMENARLESCCVICNEEFYDERPVTMTEKGLRSLIHYSERHAKVELTRYLNGLMSMTPIGKALVHSDCRKQFTKRANPNTGDEPCRKRLRSSDLPFNWDTDCFLCGKCATFDVRRITFKTPTMNNESITRTRTKL